MRKEAQRLVMLGVLASLGGLAVPARAGAYP